MLGNDGRCSLIGREIGFENIGVDANIDTSTHGNEASFEFIVEKNPQYIFVMDRDAAIGTDGAKLAQEIMDMNRGVTLIDARGAYTGERRDMVFCVVSKKEIVEVKELVRRIDPRAFVIVSDVREVLGEGFMEYRQ